jgi:uncharacterized protein YjiS (DUF1127 family)
MRPLCFALLTVLTAACAPLRPGINAYEAGRYADARRELAEVRDRAPRWSEGRRARFELYRGLTDLALGDAPRAYVRLRRVGTALDRDPTVLEASDRARFGEAWQSLGLLPGER